METTVATGREVLQTLVESIKTVGFANYYQIGTGAQLTLVVCPSTPSRWLLLALTKADVRAYIFQEARMPMRGSKALRITAIATGPPGLTRMILRPWYLWCAVPMTLWSLSQEAMAGIRLAGRVGSHQGCHGGNHDAELAVWFIHPSPVLQAVLGSARLQRGFWSRAGARRSQEEGTVDTRKHLMATHQVISGVTDEAFLQRMVRTHAERYGDPSGTFSPAM